MFRVCFEKFWLSKVPILGCQKTPKTAVFCNRNFSKRLILQLVGKDEQMDAVSYCFGHFKAVFQILAVFGGDFWKLDASKKRHFPDSKNKSETTWKIYF